MPLDNPAIQGLKEAISLGNLQQAIEELIAFTRGSSSKMTTEIYITSARYRQLESDKRQGTISLQDSKIEFNSIVASLLEIINLIQHAAVGTYQQVSPIEQVKNELAALSQEFKDTDNIQSPASRFRMKIHIARKMAEKLIPWPDLLREFKGTKDLAMICAISRKVKIVADVTDLDLLESIVPNATTIVEKGFITNAMAELIYAGQIRWGDEIRLQAMLDELGKEGPRVLLTNVARVQAALDVMTGQAVYS